MIGKTISHYKILEKLGEGGMGVVYKAEDTKLRRTVALKFLSPQTLGTEDDITRFVQEAQSAAALNHPNICTIHEIDETDGHSFITMEWVDGQVLKDKARSGPMDTDEALDIAMQVAEGLREAHERGIIHRDIKSANIIVTPRGRAKIMDFGLAKTPDRAQLTKAGTTVGTAAYMSPEQAHGGEIDHRADLWSLGVVVFEMVSGQLPFKGDHEQAVLYSIVNEEPKPLTGLRTGVPVELERIVSKCLAKDPGERYQTATDLLADLRHLQRTTTTQAPLTRAASSQTGVGRRVRRWSWVAVLVVIVAIAIGVLRRQFTPPEEQPLPERTMLVVLPFDNLGAPEDEYFADGITEEITSRLATLRELGVISRTSAIQYKATQKTIKQIGEELGVDYVLEGTVRWDRTGEGEDRVRVTPQLIRVSDDIHLWSERYDRVLEDIFGVQSDIARQVIEQLGITFLEPERRDLEAKPTENLDAYQAYLRGREHTGQEVYSMEASQLAIKMFERAVELDPAFGAAYAELSMAHSQIINLGFDRSSARLDMAKEAVEKALALQPDMPEAHLALGYYYYWGLREYEKALEELAIAGEGLPNENAILEATAWIRRRQGHWEESLEYAKRAFDLSPLSSILAREVGNIYSSIHDHVKANEYYDRSIALAPDQQVAYIFKAMNYWLGWGELEKARVTLEAMPRIDNQLSSFLWMWQEFLEQNYQAVVDRLMTQPYEIFEFPTAVFPKDAWFGFAYTRMGKPEPARRAFESALIMLEKEAAERPDDARVHSSLGVIYACLGRKEEAIREGRLGVELYPVSRDALDGPNQVDYLARIYMLVGDHESALEKIEYLLSIPSGLHAPMLRIDPQWDPLRDDPRFKRLLDRYSETG
jgi:TolB-like protein/Flp pilus assembly protein TadD/predicted Ser/Thr protein kinase